MKFITVFLLVISLLIPNRVDAGIAISEKLLSVGEAAVLLGVSVVTIRRWENQ